MEETKQTEEVVVDSTSVVQATNETNTKNQSPKKQDEAITEEKTKDKKKGKIIKGSGKKPKDEKSNLVIRAIVLGAIVFMLFVGLMYLIGKLPLIASEINNLNNEQVIMSGGNIDELRQQLVMTEVTAQKLSAYFPDESGVVDFIGEIDKLKAQGIVDSFSFASSNAIQDKTKSFGLPVLIEATGSKDQISTTIEKLQSLPYVIRPISVEITKVSVVETVNEEGETVQVESNNGTLKLEYGGIIYVDKNLGKN